MAEIKEKERLNQEELEKKKLAGEKEREEKRLEVEKLKQEIELNRTHAEETKRIGKEQEKLTVEKIKLDNFRSSIISFVLNVYCPYWGNDDISSGLEYIEGKAKEIYEMKGKEGIGYLKNMLNLWPNSRFNLTHLGSTWLIKRDAYPPTSSHRKAYKAFLRIVGNRYVTLDEFKELVEERVKSLDYLD